MADRARSYITTPIKDTDLGNFQGRIEQYDVLTGADSLDAFMRHCVSNRLLHDTEIPQLSHKSSENESPDYDVLRISEYQMFETHDKIIGHPVDEIAMDDTSVPAFPSAEVGKVILIRNFLGPQAEWPLLFFWRPESKRLGLYLPHLPASSHDLGEQDTGPLIPWAEVLKQLKEGHRIADEPEKTWQPGADTEDFAFVFMLVVKFFGGERVYETSDDEGEASSGSD